MITRDRQYADFVDIFKTLDPEIKLVCVCGNHDIGDIPTPAAAKLYRDQFGQDYFSFRYGGVEFVILNSQYFKCPDAMPDETIKQSEFIDQLALTSPKPKHIGEWTTVKLINQSVNQCFFYILVVFQHIPFFLQHPEEDDTEYFNIEKKLRLSMLHRLYNLGQ